MSYNLSLKFSMQYQIQHLIAKLAAKCNNKNHKYYAGTTSLQPMLTIGKQPDKQEALEAVLWETQLSLKNIYKLATTIAFWGHNQRTLWKLLNKHAKYFTNGKKIKSSS